MRAALAAALCPWSGNASVLTYRGLAVQRGGYGDVGATPVWSDGSLLGNYLLQRPTSIRCLLLFVGELGAIQLGIAAGVGEQVDVGAALDNAAILDDENQVGGTDS